MYIIDIDEIGDLFDHLNGYEWDEYNLKMTNFEVADVLISAAVLVPMERSQDYVDAVINNLNGHLEVEKLAYDLVDHPSVRKMRRVVSRIIRNVEVDSRRVEVQFSESTFVIKVI